MRSAHRARKEQRVQRLAAQRVDARCREHQPRGDIRLHRTHEKRRSARLFQVLSRHLRVGRTADGGLRNSARNRYAMRSVACDKSGTAPVHTEVQINGNPMHFRPIQLGQLLQHRFRALHILLGAAAEHTRIPFPRKITVRKAAPGEHCTKRLHIVGLARERVPTRGHRCCHILRALHTSFNFK